MWACRDCCKTTTYDIGVTLGTQESLEACSDLLLLLAANPEERGPDSQVLHGGVSSPPPTPRPPVPISSTTEARVKSKAQPRWVG